MLHPVGCSELTETMLSLPRMIFRVTGQNPAGARWWTTLTGRRGSRSVAGSGSARELAPCALVGTHPDFTRNREFDPLCQHGRVRPRHGETTHVLPGAVRVLEVHPERRGRGRRLRNPFGGRLELEGWDELVRRRRKTVPACRASHARPGGGRPWRSPSWCVLNRRGTGGRPRGRVTSMTPCCRVPVHRAAAGDCTCQRWVECRATPVVLPCDESTPRFRHHGLFHRKLGRPPVTRPVRNAA